MKREGHDNVNFFIGSEVEHTSVYGMNTLFVVGVQATDAIEQILDDKNALLDKSKHIKHIYFGANQSFPLLHVNDAEQWEAWQGMVQYFLEQGFFCTLDIDVYCVEGLAESCLCEYHN